MCGSLPAWSARWIGRSAPGCSRYRFPGGLPPAEMRPQVEPRGQLREGSGCFRSKLRSCPVPRLRRTPCPPQAPSRRSREPWRFQSAFPGPPGGDANRDFQECCVCRAPRHWERRARMDAVSDLPRVAFLRPRHCGVRGCAAAGWKVPGALAGGKPARARLLWMTRGRSSIRTNSVANANGRPMLLG